jgi:hypothetical protein
MTQARTAQRPSLIEVPDRHGAPKLAKRGPARPVVMVLGMHRSGTSLCSHVLSVLGVDMADKLAGPGSGTISPDNARGYWERWEIIAFHDRILAHFNRGYLSPFHDLPLPAGWWADPQVGAIRREMVGFLEKRMGEIRFGFKDPRTVRLLPVWHQIFDDLNLMPQFVLCLRNPAEVARSLTTREALESAMGEYRWVIYMMDFFRHIGAREYCAVEYEKWFDDPWVNVTKLQNFLALDWQQSRGEVDLALSDIVDPVLKHDRAKRSSTRLALARSLYELAARADNDATARKQIQQITTQFRDFQQFETPFQNAFERVSAAAARLPETERQVAELQAALADRGAAVQAGRDAAIALLQSELAAARAAVTEAENQQARASASVNAEIEGLKRNAASLQREAEERTAAASVMQAGLASLRDERARMEAEIDGLRRNVASLYREAEERTAATAAIRAELASLRDELAAARQVGRSLLAALRTGPVLAPAAEQLVRQGGAGVSS